MIKFKSVGKTFRDGTVAVVDLSLTVPSGRITAIVGPSGCGKTTTLRMVNRMIEPTSGEITWDGVPLRSKRRTALRRQMGYVIQSGGLFPHRTVAENIGTVPALLGWSRAKSRSRSMELLDAVGLDRTLANRYPAQLSGGQQQRVGVARALAADPAVLLMDEPFSAVDPVVRGELQEFFLRLQQRLSKTIVLITHDIDEAIKLGDQVAILRVGGNLAQVGTPQQLLDNPADAFVEGFVGRDRGYRSLSFLPADALRLERVQVVRDAEAVPGDEPALVVDAQAHPVGWVDPARPGQPLPLGSVFDPETDTLRAALDAALTSPRGLAVAVVKSTGRYAGVVSAEQILSQAAAARAAVARAGQGRSAAEAPPLAAGAEYLPHSREDTRAGADRPLEVAPAAATSDAADDPGTGDQDSHQPGDDVASADDDRTPSIDSFSSVSGPESRPEESRANDPADPPLAHPGPGGVTGTAATSDPAAAPGSGAEPEEVADRPGEDPYVAENGQEPVGAEQPSEDALALPNPGLPADAPSPGREDPLDGGGSRRPDRRGRPDQRSADPVPASDEEPEVDVLHLGDLADVHWRKR